MNNKISEKAVWENGITADEPDYTSVSQPIQPPVQSQPQMMFCYNCNQVIPANSAFCPWCQTELFTQCPKCGNKYSSQYPACNQCGTNKKEYLLAQSILATQKKKEQEEKQRQERIKEEERRRQELEAKEKEKERVRQRMAQEELEAEQRKLARKEIERIKQSTEYKETYDCMMYLKRYMTESVLGNILKFIGVVLLFILLPASFMILNELVPSGDVWLILARSSAFLPIFVIPLFSYISDKKSQSAKKSDEDVKRLKYLWKKLKKHKNISSEISKSMIRRLLIRKKINWDNLESEVVKTYKLVYYDIHYKYHNYRCGICGFSAHFVTMPSECPLCHAPSIVFEKLDMQSYFKTQEEAEEKAYLSQPKSSTQEHHKSNDWNFAKFLGWFIVGCIIVATFCYIMDIVIQ